MIVPQMFFTISGTFLGLLQLATTHPSLPLVEIHNNQIIGQQVSLEGKYVNEYLGIPYAEPPVGQLRFQKPLPSKNYPPVLVATTDPPACPQFIQEPNLSYINTTKKSEDCLYLNIWTPVDASPTNKKAVLFWIHGGAFRFGSIRDELYSGIALASLGDIVVVTVNYRVGLFGFLTTGTEDAPANNGLYDIIEGMKWVNNNIEAFGGDPQRITISGQSAGAISVGFLTIAPLADGLYARLITESGTPLKPMNGNSLNPIHAQQLAEAVGCASEDFPIAEHPKEIVQCLRGLDVETLSKAEENLIPTATNSFVPQFGDELLPNDPETAVFHTNFNCKDLFMGNNQDEGSLGLTTSQPELYGFYGNKTPNFSKTFAKNQVKTFITKTFPNSPLDPEVILQYYFPDSLAENDSEAIRNQVSTAHGDMLVVCPSKFYGEKCAEQRHSVYAYFFNHKPSVTKLATWIGVSHFEEVQFVFGQPLLKPGKYQDAEVTLSRQMIEIWSSFVKTGLPDSSWPLYSRENPSFKYIGPGTFTGQVGSSIYSKTCNLFRPLFGAE